MIRLLLFDLDGTLADTRNDIAAAVNRTLARADLPALHNDIVLPFVGRGVTHLLRDCFSAAGGDALAGEAAVPIFREEYDTGLVRETVLYPDVRDTLEKLSRYDMAVVSNKPVSMSRRLLAELGVAQFFPLILGGDSLPEMKPSALPLQHAMREMGAEPGETVMIGDSVYDLEAARAANTMAIAALYGFQDEAALRALRPDYAVRGFGELASLLS
ncbi:MAG: HAD-IA family hydrolase [Ignavibacteriae bacterium]|nr:HAD-IA family hydrolase [Ignavibacteriota bacterium]